MDWCRLSTSYYLDAALLRAGEGAEFLFLRCIAYSGATESNGRVTKEAMPMLAPTRTAARVTALVNVGLLVPDGDDYLIRSWGRWQEALDSESARRRKAREKKARQRDEARDKSASVPGTVPGTEGDESRGRPRHIEVEVEVEKKVLPRKRGTPAPDIFPITDSMRAWGTTHCPRVLDPTTQTAQFLDHHRANGKLFTDWTAAWRTWMTMAQRFAVRDGIKVPTEYDPAKEYLRGQS